MVDLTPCHHFAEEVVIVPEVLVEELAQLRIDYASLLTDFERALECSTQAQRDSIVFLRKLLRGAVSLDCSFQSAFEILTEKEFCLFNIYYLKGISQKLPESIR